MIDGGKTSTSEQSLKNHEFWTKLAQKSARVCGGGWQPFENVGSLVL